MTLTKTTTRQCRSATTYADMSATTDTIMALCSSPSMPRRCAPTAQRS
jgi:hypothetical protein